MNTIPKPETSHTTHQAQNRVADQQSWTKLERLLRRAPATSRFFNRNSRRQRAISPVRQSVMAELMEIWDYRELVENLAWRDLTTRYRQTALGIGWAVIQPLLTMLVAAACFGRVMHASANGTAYPIFVFSGLLLWQYFSAAVTRASNSILVVGGLIKKVYFPRSIAPIASVIPPLADFAIAFVLMIALMIMYHIPFQTRMLLAPLFVVHAWMLAMGVGFWAAALHVKYRDICHIIPFFLQLAMFASPIFYATRTIPQELQWLYFINPLFGIIDGFRWSIVGTAAPSTPSVAVSLVVSLLLLISGAIYFRLREQDFADYV